MKYKILTTNRGRWGEGWQNGDIVDMDDASARVPLENGEIEPFKIEDVIKEVEEEKAEFQCECGKVCASKAGLGAHKRHCKGV